MKTKMLLLVLLIAWVLSCKENHDTVKPKIQEQKQEAMSVTKVPPTIKELAQFAESVLSDTTNIERRIIFKEIDANGTITNITMDRAADLYKKLTKGEQATSLPIFEIKDTDTAILPIQGVGFGGAIWAKVLVDKKMLEIKKIAFEHKAESEGYGAVITQNLFENQFIGTKINLEQNTVTFQKAIEKAVDDGQIIDGLSGATMTSQGVVKMMNEGLRQYRSYLEGG